MCAPEEGHVTHDRGRRAYPGQGPVLRAGMLHHQHVQHLPYALPADGAILVPLPPAQGQANTCSRPAGSAHVPPPGWPRPQASHAPRPAHTPSRPARPQGDSPHPRGTLPAPRTAPLPAAGTPSGERFPGPQPLCVCGPGSPWGCVCLVGPWRWALAALSFPRAPRWGGPQGSKGSLCGELDSPRHRRSWLCFGVRPAAQAPQ